MLEYDEIKKRLKDTKDCLKNEYGPNCAERQILENQQTILKALHDIDFNMPKNLMAKRK